MYAIRSYYDADSFLQRLLEASSDAHNLAHRLHLGTNMAVHVPELLQVPPRILDYKVVEGRFKAGGCYASYSYNFV